MAGQLTFSWLKATDTPGSQLNISWLKIQTEEYVFLSWLAARPDEAVTLSWLAVGTSGEQAKLSWLSVAGQEEARLAWLSVLGQEEVRLSWLVATTADFTIDLARAMRVLQEFNGMIVPMEIPSMESSPPSSGSTVIN
jgi:hypothetical protein